MAGAARLKCIEMLPAGSQVHAHRQHDGVAEEIIRAVGCLSGKLCGYGGWEAAGHSMRRAITKLVCDVDIKPFAFVPGAEAEELPVQVRRERAVISIWHRVLTIYIAGAHMPAVVEIPRHAEPEHPTRLPIQSFALVHPPS